MTEDKKNNNKEEISDSKQEKSVKDESTAQAAEESVKDKSAAEAVEESVKDKSAAEAVEESVKDESEAEAVKESVKDESEAEAVEESVKDESTAEAAAESVKDESAAEVAEEPVKNEKTLDKNSSDEENERSNNSDTNLKFPFIIGKKIGMSQLFLDNGVVLPVTIIEAGPCYISQLKTDENDGYTAIQLSYEDSNKNNKPLAGHFKNAGIDNKKYLKEFRYSNIDEVKLGSEINLSQYNEGDFVNVTGYSKGKGFAGHMKRHNFSGGRASHGKNSVMRKAGSVGAGTDPGKVWKGTRMAGRMGNDKVTVKNIQVVRVDKNKNLIFLNGSVPGANNKIIYLNKSK